jgi:osmotically-inducible protein OsmY
MKTPSARIGKGAGLLTGDNFQRSLFAMAAVLMVTFAQLRASDTMAENEEDAAISNQVKRSLLYHLSLNFHVKTIDGVVTLSGKADDIAEKDMDTKLAIEIKGVKSVVNSMVIPTTIARND